MTALPQVGFFSQSRTEGELAAWWEALRDAVAELPGGAAAVPLTISADAITPTGWRHILDTEAGAPTDNLSTIGQTNTPDGRIRCRRPRRGTP